jgi:hypothetical protein
MQLPRIFFDESGNTGENLLDPTQPLYCLTSVNFDDKTSQDLLNLIQTPANERHFKQLKKYEKSQNQILQILNHPSVTDQTVKYGVFHKEYTLVGHLVDRFIEPVYYDFDIDIYRGGLNIILLDAIFYSGFVKWSRELYLNLLQSLQQLVRRQTPDDINAFYKALEELFKSSPDDDQIFLPLLKSREQIDSILEGLHKYVIDPSLSAFVPICDRWGREVGAFDVFHDDSKQMEFWREWIAWFSSSEKFKHAEIGFDERKLLVPMPVKDLVLVNSKHCSQIQLADIIGSAVTYCLKTIVIDKDTNDSFANKIHQSRIMKLATNSLWPNPKIKEYKIDESEINTLDYLADANAAHREEFNKLLEKMKRSPRG